MSSIGTGYDYSATTYSPDGRVFQVEYAGKAVENSGTCIGLRVKDGVVLAVEKLVTSKLLVAGSNRRIGNVDRHIGVATTGLAADGRQMINRARSEARNHWDIYKSPISGKQLTDRLGLFTQAYTLYGSVRPFGISTLIASYTEAGPELYNIEPSGLYFGYFGCAIGKGKQAAKTEIEKLNLSEMTAREAVFAAAKIIHSVHDSVKDKDFELEISWVGAETNGLHQLVPKDLLAEADARAQESLAAQMDQDD